MGSNLWTGDADVAVASVNVATKECSTGGGPSLMGACTGFFPFIVEMTDSQADRNTLESPMFPVCLAETTIMMVFSSSRIAEWWSFILNSCSFAKSSSDRVLLCSERARPCSSKVASTLVSRWHTFLQPWWSSGVGGWQRKVALIPK